MKKTFLSFILSLFFLPLFAQDQELGLPGDNLNLYSVLDIFQKSKTLEEFEQSLNVQGNQVNNLDLNGDGKIDYIHVVDNVTGSSHAIALQVDVNENETQDVAVIEVDKDANSQIHIQAIGDEALYGKDYIVEPNQTADNSASDNGSTEATTTYVPNNWAIFDYIYDPSFFMYVSPYHWGYYPGYWQPWYPVNTYTYIGYQRPYHGFFRRGETYRSPAVHSYYSNHHASSPIVRERSNSYMESHRPGNHTDSHRPYNPSTRGSNRPDRSTVNRNGSSGRNGEAHTNNGQPPRSTQSSHSPNQQPSRTSPTQHTVQPTRTTPTQHSVQPTRTTPTQHTVQPTRTTPTQHTVQPTRTYSAPRQTSQPTRTYSAPRQTSQPTRTYSAPTRTYSAPTRTYSAPRSSPSPVKRK